MLDTCTTCTENLHQAPNIYLPKPFYLTVMLLSNIGTNNVAHTSTYHVAHDPADPGPDRVADSSTHQGAHGGEQALLM